MVPFRRLSQRSCRRSSENRDSYEWQDERDKRIMTATFPIHPIAAMQAPFEESMLDATGETGHVPFVNPKKGIKTRQQLLCREEDATEDSWNFTYNCHWRNNPKGNFHPLKKTVAQIIFGVHLLHQHLEKSVADVADILLKHVNELDSFLQRANEDLESSMKDMMFRHKCLKVPMEHVNEFDRLLEDRSYRAQLLDGNIVIERTIGRMSALLNDYLVDINVFREANQDLDMYLLDVGDAWTYRNEDIGRIYSAMCGNTGGWSQFLLSLVAKAERLGVVLVQTSQPEYYPDTWHNEEQRGRATPQAEASRTSRLFGNRGHVSLSSDAPVEEKPPAIKRQSAGPDNGEYSPPWTGKDSAYSSVSGASAMSPAMASTRSASSMSSRQTAQFGLFPTRNLSTPKGSMSSRLGAASPAFDQPDQFFKPDIPSRPATSMSNFSDSSPKRLSKRSSFSSLKRLFSKKRTGDIDAIAE
ncbi:conserved hypothetical protein [Pyrenophora tritici-repentis Pt-1C-BFP]|uniref:Uncharacterized protein n=1 Tax=Pyrenophora tritici-repentis (strain Pt-1C-BFP) TaxID=426418 RepID=B2W8V8_PYRTR|nr:uncharacterized protein PTRG_06416 [Pyrenophora tritici-repentis Pt-1C-BFP]EDU49336.1 conserved hypothetical protein [Pyrenophora tritici-repentis Pt-1C-BFP]